MKPSSRGLCVLWSFDSRVCAERRSFWPYQARPFESFARGGGGGSEARMLKIKVSIIWLKWNFAWGIIGIKACLMQNVSLLAFVALQIWRHKIVLSRREQVIEFGYLPPENWFNFMKRFMSRFVLFDPKLTPLVNFSNFQAEENFSFSKFFRRLHEKSAGATALIDQFC